MGLAVGRRVLSLADIGEFGFIRRLARRVPRAAGVEIGIGDDSAVVRAGGRRILLTTDSLIEDVHFRSGWDTPEGLGRKAFAVNASDIAAMGGRPRFAILAVAVPARTPAGDLEAFHRGFLDEARRARCALVGGNLTSAEKWMITVTLMGEVGGVALTRRGARVGDRIYVSGRLGASAYGREILLHGRRPAPPGLTLSFRRPKARLALGQALSRACLATAAIDVSDGLLADLGHLCRASGVGAVVEAERLPLARSLERLSSGRRLALALSGGEDYELLFTVSREAEGRLADVRSARTPVQRIGEIVRGRRVKIVDGEGSEIAVRRRGYDHFR